MKIRNWKRTLPLLFQLSTVGLAKNSAIRSCTALLIMIGLKERKEEREGELVGRKKLFVAKLLRNNIIETMKLRNLLIIFGLLLITTVADAEVLFSHRVVYYDISGSTHQQLKYEMISKGNIRDNYISAANTKVIYNSKVTKAQEGSSCKVEHIKILVDVVQTYPRWINMYRGSQSLIDEWSQYMAATITHEDRHMSEGLEAASKLDKHLQSFNWSSDCRTIDKQLNEEFHKILGDYKNNGSLVYDRETNHGLGSGTRW